MAPAGAHYKYRSPPGKKTNPRAKGGAIQIPRVSADSFPDHLFEPSALGVSKRRAAEILKTARLLPTWSAEGAVEIVKQTAFWRTKAGKPLAPTSRMSIATAVSHALFVLTGLAPSTSPWKSEIRKLKAKISHHIPRQAVPATRTDIKRAIAREPVPLIRLALAFVWGLGLRAGHACRFQGRDLVNKTTLDHDKVAILRARGLKGMRPGKRGYFKYLPLAGMCSPLLPHLAGEFRPKQRLLPVSRVQLVKALQRANPALTGHSPRVGSATRLANLGASHKVVRDFLGHESVQSTRMYVQPRAGQRDVMRKVAVASRNL